MARGSLELYIQREDPAARESEARMCRQNRLRCEDLTLEATPEDALRPKGMRVAGERGRGEAAFFVDVRYSSYDVIIYADGPGMSLLADAFSDAVTWPAGRQETLLVR